MLEKGEFRVAYQSIIFYFVTKLNLWTILYVLHSKQILFFSKCVTWNFKFATLLHNGRATGRNFFMGYEDWHRSPNRYMGPFVVIKSNRFSLCVVSFQLGCLIGRCKLPSGPGMMWNGMEDDFYIFHTSNFLPFHFHSILKIFHSIFHSILKLSSVFHSILLYQKTFWLDAMQLIFCTFAML